MTATSGVRLAIELSCGLTLMLSIPLPTTPQDGWPVQFHDVADRAGLRVPSVYGGVDRKRFIIETNGAGVAWIDLDDDGWVDAIVLGGTRLASGTRHDDPEIARAGIYDARLSQSPRWHV